MKKILFMVFVAALIGCETTAVEIIHMKDGMFSVVVEDDSGIGMMKIREIAMVHAAEKTIALGFSRFKIIDSWAETELQEFGAIRWNVRQRTIIVKPTNDPADFDAQEILDTLGPAEY